jgi:two-component sensor histidine kinase
MLQLHASAAESEDVRYELRHAGTRISAVARAHRRLYSGDEVDALDLGGYLREVCKDTAESMPDCDIEVSAAADVIIETDRAVPAVLLVNELITNAVKYAYPGCPCKVWVTLGLQSRDAAMISVRDEGVGLPPDFDRGSGRLGMRLVKSFAQQIDGELDIVRRQPGTEFVLKFPLRT